MRMKKHWFYKTLLSYLPIFFMLSSVLFLVFFFALSEYIKTSTIKSIEIIGEQLDQSVENILQPIDKVIIRDILVDETIRQFFDEQGKAPYTIYRMNQKLNNLLLNFSIIDSLYIYRYSDGQVVTESAFSNIDDFEDRDFLLQHMAGNSLTSWSGKRVYKDSKRPASTEVVTLIRKAPFQTGRDGVIVVNIRVDVLREMVADMSKLDISFVRMLDADGGLIFTTLEEGADSGEVISRVQSDYTNWEISTGVQSKYRFGLLSSFPYVWIGIGFVSILLGLASIVYVTRRNYKPIESIFNRISSMVGERGGGQDEIRMIDMAVDKLLEQSRIFQSQFEYDAHRLRHHLFMELLEEGFSKPVDEWKKEMRRLSLPSQFDHFVFAVMEIDRFADFMREYTDREQDLLKYVIYSAVQEMAAESGGSLWAEWIHASQLGILYFAKEAEVGTESGDGPMIDLGERAARWSEQNLKFTVTFGIGGDADKASELPQLYGHALDALNHKPFFGNGAVIQYRNLPDRPAGDLYRYMELIRAFVHHYRMGGENWQQLFSSFMDELQSGLSTREDILRVLNYLLYHLNQKMSEHGGRTGIWEEKWMPELADKLSRFDTLEDFRMVSTSILTGMQSYLQQIREQKSYSQSIRQVRKWIDVNYANPELSLLQLSEEFNLSTRILSKLFKEEFGEKFIDYLVHVRMEAAKRLLMETTDSVQVIALKVGYVHSFSFIRVFKKVVGVTPGDFRK
ncbi:AraC family transcriptional regulator [Paenibacillus sepulcri]|uniref:AraC family transcriptional regulator n=1 Tax=Paenibacillus sepulcri TaxID=359917 RepID=A0ABS7C1Z8_9BACL|nr:AraC family transcriptional regulator [Paenibacillus sepulcri]